IHPNTKPVAITIYGNNDKSNFNVHKHFKFGDFGVTEWDELGAITPRKKNKVVEDMMTSLRKKYDRLKVITSELGINPTFPAPEQVPSLSSGRKRKAQELEPGVCILRLECNRGLPEGVQFVNNKVIEYPKHGILFIDVLVIRPSKGSLIFIRWMLILC
nr:hypothetical protein [Tanacetum cinerariifolium]